jgi:chorismate mutase
MDSKHALALVAALTLCATGTTYPQNTTVDRLRPLVSTSAKRLFIAKRVALAKWDSGAPVEDASREEQVIVTATNAAEARGLDPSSVRSFFRAQIEANKLIQYSLLADWRRVGKAPGHASVDLAKTIRPELDQLQTELIAELVDTSSIRSSASCRTDMAKAVGEYVSEHKAIFGNLQAIALDRAMAASCAS